MTRIVYLIPSTAHITGGQKVSVRHVQALRAAGFHAEIAAGGEPSASPLLSALDKSIFAAHVQESDIVVVPEDQVEPLRYVSQMPNEKVVFIQNHIVGVSSGILRLEASELERFDHFIACSHMAAI